MIPTLERELTVSEAANFVGVHPNTLRSYADQGFITFIKLPSGHRRFRREHLEEFRKRLLNQSVTPPTKEQLAQHQKDYEEDKLAAQV